jgi:hypothetical protein
MEHSEASSGKCTGCRAEKMRALETEAVKKGPQVVNRRGGRCVGRGLGRVSTTTRIGQDTEACCSKGRLLINPRLGRSCVRMQQNQWLTVTAGVPVPKAPARDLNKALASNYGRRRCRNRSRIVGPQEATATRHCVANRQGLGFRRKGKRQRPEQNAFEEATLGCLVHVCFSSDGTRHQDMP